MVCCVSNPKLGVYATLIKDPTPLKSTCFTSSLPGPAGYSELWMQQDGHSRLGQGRTHCGCIGEASDTFEM